MNITMLNMGTDDFMDLPDYAANRDVTKRMKKPHLSGELSPSQLLVAAVRFNGVLSKLDGHSRSEAWKRGQLAKPESVYVTVYDVSSESEIHELYDSYTSKLTAATASEEMHTAKARSGFNPVSKLGKSSWKSAFIVAGCRDVNEAVLKYANELEMIDSLMIQKSRDVKYSVGIKAAMLETYSDNPDIANAFWSAYRDEGSAAEVNRLLVFTKTNSAANGAYFVGILYSQALGCFEAYKQSRNPGVS